MSPPGSVTCVPKQVLASPRLIAVPIPDSASAASAALPSFGLPLPPAVPAGIVAAICPDPQMNRSASPPSRAGAGPPSLQTTAASHGTRCLPDPLGIFADVADTLGSNAAVAAGQSSGLPGSSLHSTVGNHSLFPSPAAAPLGPAPLVPLVRGSSIGDSISHSPGHIGGNSISINN